MGLAYNTWIHKWLQAEQAKSSVWKMVAYFFMFRFLPSDPQLA